MSKKQRHELRKTERARRMRAGRKRPAAIRNGATVIAASAAIAAGTSAYAVPLRFDNPAHGEPGHFHWAVPVGDNTNWLDFTVDAAAQPGLADGPTSLRHAILSDLSYGFGNVGRNSADIDMAVNYINYTNLLVGLESGELIGAGGLAWNFYGYATNVYYGLEAFPEDLPKYLGVRFDTGSGDQYAWIGVTRSGHELDAFAWGYETEPGVPIAAGAPEPGSLALLAFGAAGACVRRHRKSPKND